MLDKIKMAIAFNCSEIITKSTFIEIRCRDPEKTGVLSTQVSTHSVGGVAHYSCPRGFYMEGNETRICLQNGSWSGTTPACFCKKFFKSNNIIFFYF